MSRSKKNRNNTAKTNIKNDSSQKIKKCWGFTVNFKRCNNKRNVKSFFCEKHRYEIILYILTAILIPCFSTIVFEKISHNDKHNTSIYQQAEKFYNEGNFVEAEKKFNELLDIDYNFPNAKYLYGQTLINEKKYTEAIKFLKEIPEKEYHSDLNYYIGMSYFQKNENKLAAEYFKKALNDFSAAKDNRYWETRSMYVCAENFESDSSLSVNAKIVNQIIDNRILNQSTQTVQSNTAVEFNSVDFEEVFYMKSAAAYLLRYVALSNFKNRSYFSCIDMISKSFTYQRSYQKLFYPFTTDDDIMLTLRIYMGACNKLLKENLITTDNVLFTRFGKDLIEVRNENKGRSPKVYSLAQLILLSYNLDSTEFITDTSYTLFYTEKLNDSLGVESVYANSRFFENEKDKIVNFDNDSSSFNIKIPIRENTKLNGLLPIEIYITNRHKEIKKQFLYPEYIQ